MIHENLNKLGIIVKYDDFFKENYCDYIQIIMNHFLKIHIDMIILTCA